jgi:hypothetical protein
VLNGVNQYSLLEVDPMPRLVGKQSNSSAYISLAVVAIVGAAVSLEYTGAVDYVPQFGAPTANTLNLQGKAKPSDN